jgi:hypothetical protein
MYLRQARGSGVTASSNVGGDYGGDGKKLARNQVAAKRYGRQIDPAILFGLAHKGQPFQEDAAWARVGGPALASDFESGVGGLLTAHFCDGEMRNVGPLFLKSQRFGIQFAVQFDHMRGAVEHPDVDCGGHGREGFHVAQGHLERLLVATNALQNLQSGTLGTAQRTGWQNRQMGRQMRQIAMQLATELFYESSGGILEVRHQRVTGILHLGENYTPALERG